MSAKVHLISGCANREVADDAEEVTRCGIQLRWSSKSSPAEPTHDEYGVQHVVGAYTRPGEARLFAATRDRGGVTCMACNRSLVRSWGIN